MTQLLKRLFARCEELGASDIHLAVDQPPRFRVLGRLVPDAEIGVLKVEAVDETAMELGLSTLPLGCPDGTERVRLTLVREGSLDGAVSSAGGARYRFNLFRESGRTAVAIRRLESGFRTLAELGLPARLAEFCDAPDGLVVVTGPTGSGKSTTLATLLDRINETREGHIITIEDPVEYVHATKRCLVNQRQVGRDAKSFNDALVEALRQDPDVILVGEVRDLATVRTALRAAETGHLVFTTLHAGDCAGAVERLVSVFPAEEQPGVRRQLALVLRGVFAQHLIRSKDGTRRHAAAEMLVNTAAVANLIATGRSAHLYSAIETGQAYGMRTLDQSLVDLVRAGRITESAAAALTHNPESFRTRMAGAGNR